MRFIKIATLFLTALSASASNVDGVAATVNGRVITKSEVESQVSVQEKILGMMHANNPQKVAEETAKLRREAVDSLIERELILAEFTKKGGSIRPEYVDDEVDKFVRENFQGDRAKFVQELTKAGLTVDRFRETREKMMIVQAMRGSVNNRMFVAKPDDIEKYYREHDADFRDKGAVNISTLTIPKYTPDPATTLESQRKLANEIHGKIDGGTSFASMAKTYSQDSKASEGGLWGWVDETNIRPQYLQVAQSLSVGGISPVIEDAPAFVIIRLNEQKLGPKKPLSEVRDGIERILRMEHMKAIQDQWVAELRQHAVIRKY